MKHFYNILLIFISLHAFSQENPTSTNKKAVKYFNEGIDQLKARKFKEAIQYFTDAVEKDPNFIEAHYQLGILYKNYFRNVKLVKHHFSRILEIDSSYKSPAIERVLGEIYIREGDYTLAKKYFTKYIQNKNEPPAYIQKSERYIKQCEYALEMKQHPVKLNPVLLPKVVNSHAKQYFPVSTADQQYLVFTVRDKVGSTENEDIYVSKKENGQWEKPQPISDNINTLTFNEGTCSISADGKVLAFTICGGKSNNDLDCDIYISYKEGDEWSKPKNLGTNVNSSAWDSQPSLSADGKTMYFSSRRKGGMGEEDIWVVQADANGRWGTPLNMGDLINTPGREVGPFIHPSMSTLYFASDYHLGFGSFDLFVSYKDSVNWSEPKNLGYPINTYLEESSIFITSDCRKAYYSAETKDDKGNDSYLIYEFDMPKEDACLQQSTYAKGTIYDAVTKLPIQAHVELINLKTEKAECVLNSDAVNGSYLVVLNENSQYGLYVSKQNYLYNSHSFDYENMKTFDPLTLDVYLQPIRKGSSITLNNIFFETGKYKLEKKSTTELDKLVDFLNQNMELRVEISGHTDNVGQKQNNLILSTKRAESVLDHLIENGIDPKRINYKGYGDSKPIASNETEQTRMLNRRIECKIL